MKFNSPECQTCKSRNSSLFHFCHIDELNLIANEKSCVQYKTGQPVFPEGSHSTGLFCVNEGKIKLHRMGTDGKEQIVRLVKPGDFIGYRALMSGTPYSASASTLEDSTICFVPKNVFFSILKKNDSFSEGMMKLLCRNLEESEKKLTEMAYKPVRERLAEALLLIKGTFEEKETTKGPYTVNFSREDLASLVGTAKETVIRLLSEMKNDKIVRTEGRKIILLEPQKLIEIANMYD